MVAPSGSNGDSEKQPLILTLWINEQAQIYFDDLRWSYFPPQRNYLAAHLTLFHALPDERYIDDDIMALSEKLKVFDVKAREIVSIGNGTAIKIDAPILISIHRRFQERWHQVLSGQDKQNLWPHITIQNKVSADEAKKLKERLAETFKPLVFKAIGLKLWRYLGGPWEPVKAYKFPFY